MIYTQLFNQVAPHKVVKAAVIGTGHFATATVTQAQSMRRLQVAAVADLNVDAAKSAYFKAGLSENDLRVCETRGEALKALEQGLRVIVRDSSLLMDLPLDVIMEATGNPEAAARHAVAAIGQGKQVVMATKETDCAVGPILNYLASRAGVVYTQADGDQHGMLIALIDWARELGLEILTAGKARDSEFLYDHQNGVVTCGSHSVHLSEEEKSWLAPIKNGREAEFVEARHRILKELPQVAGYDVSELCIAANATGLEIEVDALLCPVLHTPEIPRVLCPREEGGIVSKSGVIDAVTSLHYPEEAHLGGGVFMTVRCQSEYSRHILATKGCLSNHSGDVSLVYRPYHLCGVETPITLLCAGLLGLSTGVSKEYRLQYDMVAKARRDLKAGETIDNDHSPDLQALIKPASPLGGAHPLPFHLGVGHQLREAVPAGTVITADMVEAPTDSQLWQLRQQQDKVFQSRKAPFIELNLDVN